MKRAYLTALFLLSLTGCIQHTVEVDFILPDNFKGNFSLLEDPDGQVIDESQDHVRLVIPPTGVLKVQSIHLFQDWGFHENYFTQSGKILPSQDESSHPGIVGVYATGGTGTVNGKGPQQLFYFVGTPSDFMHRPSTP